MSRSRQAVIACFLAAACAGGLLAARSEALPRYAARYGQRCGLCHVNPSGAGMRVGYATQQLVPNEIAWSHAGAESLLLPGPQLTRSVAIGSDFREFYIGSNRPAHNLDFFQMQGDLYVSLQLDAKTLLYFDHGISTADELFGLAYVLPLTGYLKAGRFVPSYGWKFDDHTMYVRSQLGFMPPAHSDVGVELGLQPGHLDVQLGLVNGSRGATFDTDHRLAQSANVIYRRTLAGIGVGIGASGYHQLGPRTVFDTGGGYGSLVWRPLTWLGEIDLARSGERHGPRTTAVVSSQELSVFVHQGLQLLATYDFFDPDRRLRSGSQSRWGVGVHAMPRPYLALDAAFRRTRVDAGPAVATDEFDETLLQLHFVY